MDDRRFRHAGPGGADRPGSPSVPDLDRDLLEACRGAVDRVLAGLPAPDRLVLEGHQDEVVAATHRETRAALERLVVDIQQVA